MADRLPREHLRRCAQRCSVWRGHGRGLRAASKRNGSRNREQVEPTLASKANTGAYPTMTTSTSTNTCPRLATLLAKRLATEPGVVLRLPLTHIAALKAHGAAIDAP